MNPDMLSEADQLLQELEQMRLPGDEQALGILPTDEATAAAHAGVGQGFNQVSEYLTTNMTSWRNKEGSENTGVGNSENGMEIIGENGSVIATGNFIAEGEHGLVYGVRINGFDDEFAFKIINDPAQYDLEVKEYRYQKDVFGQHAVDYKATANGGGVNCNIIVMEKYDDNLFDFMSKLKGNGINGVIKEGFYLQLVKTLNIIYSSLKSIQVGGSSIVDIQSSNIYVRAEGDGKIKIVVGDSTMGGANIDSANFFKSIVRDPIFRGIIKFNRNSKEFELINKDH